MEKTNFRNELERLNKGIRIAWAINFIILALTIESALIVIFMIVVQDNKSLTIFMLITSIISFIIAGITTASIAKNSGKILMNAADGNMRKINNGIIYDVVNEMSIASMQKMPEVYVAIGSPVANAYAISDSETSRIVITDKLLNIMTREELQGVVGHEIAHIASGDSQAMTTLTALTSVTGLIAGIARDLTGNGINASANRDYDDDHDSKSNSGSANPIAIIIYVVALVFLIAAPFLAKIAESYMSRERESTADMLSVKYTRNPTALANALFKLKYEDGHINKQEAQKFNRMAGQVAFYIPNFEGMALATHPPLDKRIEKLVNMGAVIRENEGLSVVERMNENNNRNIAHNNAHNNMPMIPGIQPGYNPRIQNNHQMPPYNANNQPQNPANFKRPWAR